MADGKHATDPGRDEQARVTPVILSGGAGTRLWPLSRSLHPKQFLPLVGKETMLVGAIRRNMGEGFTPPIVICHADHRFLVAEELRLLGLTEAVIILEPEGRNTAPAAVLAALAVARGGADRLVLLTPSDHTIKDLPAYRNAVATATRGAAAGALVTFGVVPSRPETGYGYLKRRETTCAPGCFWLDRFVEKPDPVTAAAFVADGAYLWNSGMFLFEAGKFLAEATRLAPTLVETCREALDRARIDGAFVWLDPTAFGTCPAGSIDTVIMEKAAAAAVVPIEVGWNDVGSWQSLWETSEHDSDGNTTVGDVLVRETSGSYLWSSGLLVTAVGLDDMIVVATNDAVLVCPKDRSQEVKGLVETLSRQGRSEPHSHILMRRPWGAYESLGRGDRFQVKRLIVNPGKRLSIQLHYHRSEHWVVVRGTARILNGDQEVLLFENQSTYIAAGTKHRLENPGIIPLELIEVQSGSYLGEDDIVRYEDDFGRR